MSIKELGHIVLYVRNLERSRHFYGETLGWRQLISPDGNSRRTAMFSSGRSHHELLLIEVGPDAEPIPRGRRVGMYHFGLKVGETDQELQDVLAEIQAAGVTVVGATDHGVTHSLYIEDPDGNEIELYIDVQPELWREHPEAVFARPAALRL